LRQTNLIVLKIIKLMISIDKIIPLLIEKKNTVLSFLIGGILLASIISFLQPKLYKSFSRIIFDYESVNSPLLKNSGSLANEENRIYSNDNLKSTIQALIKSNNRSNFSLLNKTINQMNNSDFESTAFQNQYIQNINQSIEITSDDATTSIGITVVSKNAIETADIANTLANSFIKSSVANSKKIYLVALKNLEKRKTENRTAIQRNNRNLNEYIAKASLKSLNPNDEKLVNKIAELEAELESVELENNYSISNLEHLKSILGKEFPDVNHESFSVSSPKISNVKSLLEKVQTEKLMFSATKKVSNLNIEYPWKKLQKKFDTDSLNNVLRNLVFNLVDKDFSNIKNIVLLKNLAWKIEETNSRLNAIDFTKSIIYNLLTNLEDKFNTIPIRYIELARLVRIKKFNTKLDFKIKSKELKLKENEKNYLAEIDSITRAIIPTTSFSPNIILNLIWGFLIGLLAGILFALFSSSKTLDNIDSADDLERANYKVISQIPHFPNTSYSMLKLQTKNEISVSENKLVRSFQNIDAFLKYGNLEKEIKSILVTSSIEQEGKSLVAANIAASIASNQEKVLLIDANFIFPNLDKFFNITPSPSLPHYLFKKKSFDEIIKTTKIKNLSLITCIELSHNPTVIMTSERMKEFMNKVKSEFDYVIYDSSSISSLKETVEIAKNVDEVILIARANHTQLPDLNKTKLLLNENGINNFDVVLNDVIF